ncbi:hypothetical protein PQX77_015308 [Marasmius sp. AFHP31]|nr:hypothetical protein PQX77_015308 [Marasmius sp. AFHP31]
MITLPKIFTFLSLCLTVQVLAREVTVNAADREITYTGGFSRQIPVCKSGEDTGNCWRIREPPCTESSSNGQGNESLATWKFTGSSLRITSLIGNTSPLYNIEIDGNTTVVDGANMPGTEREYTCYTLYSVDGLSDSEHTVFITVKGPSPNRNMSADVANGSPNLGQLSIVNYTYTTNSAGDGNGGISHLPVSGTILVLTALAVYLGIH